MGCSKEFVQEILESMQSPDQDYRSPCGCTPVIVSLDMQRPDITLLLLESGMSTSGIACSREKSPGWSAIHLASRDSSAIDVLKVLLVQESTTEMHLDYTVHPIHVAVDSRNHEALGLLLDHYLGPLESSLDTQSSLDSQASSGKIMGRSFLLNHRIAQENPFGPSELLPEHIQWPGPTPLHIAALSNDETSTRMLLKYGADVDSPDNVFCTPLYLAVQTSHFQVADVLLNNGANIHSRDFVSNTIGLQSGNVEILERLEKLGLDLSVSNIFGESLMDIALIRDSSPDMVVWCDRNNISTVGKSTRALYALSAFLNGEGRAIALNSISSVLEVRHLEMLGFPHILRLGHSSFLRKLLKRLSSVRGGAIDNVNCRGPVYPRKPLWMAAASGVPGGVEALIEAGAIVELDQLLEDDPLIAACQAGRMNVVKFLTRYVSMKANTNVFGTHDAIAASKHFPKIKTWLLQHRWTEQRRLEQIAKPSSEGALLRPWSGLDRKGIPLTGRWGRYYNQSTFDHAVQVYKQRRYLFGKVLCWDSGKPHPFVIEN